MSLHPHLDHLSLSLGLAAVSHLVVVVGFALFESSSTATQLPSSLFLLPSFLAARPPVLLLLPPPSFLQLPSSFRNRARLKLPLSALCLWPSATVPHLAGRPASSSSALCWVGGNYRAVPARACARETGGAARSILHSHICSLSESEILLLSLSLSPVSTSRHDSCRGSPIFRLASPAHPVLFKLLRQQQQ